MWTAATDDSAGADNDFALESVTDFDLLDETILITGTDREKGSDEILIADVNSGEIRTSIRADDPLGSTGATVDFLGVSPKVARQANEQIVLVEYKKEIRLGDGSPGRELGFAAISARDGAPRWMIPVHTGAAYTKHVTVQAADDTTALINIWQAENDHTTESKTIAFDLASRKERWQANGVEPIAISRDSVIGDAATLPSELGKPSQDRAIIGLDVESGAQRWDTTGIPAISRVDVAPTANALVASSTDWSTVLDATTGHPLTGLNKKIESCESDDPKFIACTAEKSSADTIVTVGVANNDAEIAELPELDGFHVDDVARGRIFASDDAAQDNRTLELDGAGHVVTDRLPGVVGAVNGSYVVFYTGLLDNAGVDFSVHRVRSDG